MTSGNSTRKRSARRSNRSLARQAGEALTACGSVDSQPERAPGSSTESGRRMKKRRSLPAGFAPLTAATEPATTRAIGHGLRLVHGEVPAADLVLVELGDRAPGAVGIAHLD